MRKEYTGETQLPDDGSISTTGLVAAAAANDKLALQVFEKVGELSPTAHREAETAKAHRG